MSDRFSACLTEALRWEGLWSDHPADPGGPTMKGVTIGVYAGYLGIQLTLANDKKTYVRDATFEAVKARLRKITDAEVADIYRKNYWNAVRADELPAGVDLAAVDFCYNAGPGQAVKSLQRVLGVKIDSHLGPATMAAVQRSDPTALIRTYLAERRRFYRALRTFPTFGKGWLRRADGIEAVALEMARPAGAPVMVVAAAAPLPDADAQSASQAKAPTEAPKPPWITEIATSITGVVTKVAGLSTAFSKWSAKPAATFAEVTLFFLAEPLVIAGIVMLFGALTTYLWRRRVGAQ